MAILIVEDNVLLGEYFKDVLHNYQVFCSKNGKEALEFLLKPTSPVGLILCDCEMPIMDGSDFIKTIKTSPEYNALKIPVIGTGSFPFEDKDLFLRKEYVKEFISKPITSCVLQDIVKKYYQE